MPPFNFAAASTDLVAAIADVLRDHIEAGKPLPSDAQFVSLVLRCLRAYRHVSVAELERRMLRNAGQAATFESPDFVLPMSTFFEWCAALDVSPSDVIDVAVAARRLLLSDVPPPRRAPAGPAWSGNYFVVGDLTLGFIMDIGEGWEGVLNDLAQSGRVADASAARAWVEKTYRESIVWSLPE